MNMDLYIKPQN